MSSAMKIQRLSNSIDLLADQIKQLNLGDYSTIASPMPEPFSSTTKMLNTTEMVCPLFEGPHMHTRVGNLIDCGYSKTIV